MTEETQAEILRDVLATAASLVFRDEAPRAGGDSESMQFVAVIGFTGQQVRGSLVVGASRRQALELIGDTLARVPTDSDMADWVGEMANLTLGRVKFLLCKHGLDLQITTPVLLRGMGLVWRERTAGCHSVSLHEGSVQVHAWFDVRATEPWQAPAPEDEALDSGDFVLF